MVPSLRKKHFLIWSLLALLLPLLLIATLLIRPKTFHQTSLPQAVATAFPTLIESKESDAFSINLRSNPNGRQQIEIILKEALQFPSATVIIQPNKQAATREDITLGQLGNHGTYRFDWPPQLASKGAFHLKIYDHIKEQQIANIPF